MMLQVRMGHISSPPFWRYSITKVPLNALSGARQAAYLRLELSVDRAVPCSMLLGIARGAADPPLFSSLPSGYVLTSVWLVKRSAPRFGREVSPRHHTSSNRSGARRHRSEKQSCRSRSGLCRDEFRRSNDYWRRICFAGSIEIVPLAQKLLQEEIVRY